MTLSHRSPLKRKFKGSLHKGVRAAREERERKLNQAAEQLCERVRKIIRGKDEQTDLVPYWIATEAMNQLDADHSLDPEIHVGCHMQCRQFARAELRAGTDRALAAGGGIDPETGLQARYPRRARDGGEHAYRSIRLLGLEDGVFNLIRGRRKARTIDANMDRLESYLRGKFGGAEVDAMIAKLERVPIDTDDDDAGDEVNGVA